MRYFVVLKRNFYEYSKSKNRNDVKSFKNERK